MPLTRTDHWATRELHEFFLAAASKPFEWGVNDCCLFPADAILAFTGVDLAAEFRGRYASEKDAFALIAEITGGTTVADAAAWCAEKHGLAEYKFPLMAKRGDLAVIQESEGSQIIAGIVGLTGRHVITVGEDGLKRLPITTVKTSWSV